MSLDALAARARRCRQWQNEGAWYRSQHYRWLLEGNVGSSHRLSRVLQDVLWARRGGGRQLREGRTLQLLESARGQNEGVVHKRSIKLVLTTTP